MPETCPTGWRAGWRPLRPAVRQSPQNAFWMGCTTNGERITHRNAPRKGERQRQPERLWPGHPLARAAPSAAEIKADHRRRQHQRHGHQRGHQFARAREGARQPPGQRRADQQQQQGDHTGQFARQPDSFRSSCSMAARCGTEKSVKVGIWRDGVMDITGRLEPLTKPSWPCCAAWSSCWYCPPRAWPGALPRLVGERLLANAVPNWAVQVWPAKQVWRRSAACLARWRSFVALVFGACWHALAGAGWRTLAGADICWTIRR